MKFCLSSTLFALAILVLPLGAIGVVAQQPVSTGTTTTVQPATNQEAANPVTNSAQVGTGQAATAVDERVKKIGYRLPAWQRVHLHDPKMVKEQTATLERLGCEVQQNNHGNHIDLQFRCANWKSLTLETDEQVQQWKTWFGTNKFETLVINPPVQSPLPTVKFRLNDWKTMHLHQQEQVVTFSSTFKMLGCEVETANHGNHVDAKIRCADWITIELPSEDVAHSWQGWLNQSGFETQHTHVHAHQTPGATNQRQADGTTNSDQPLNRR